MDVFELHPDLLQEDGDPAYPNRRWCEASTVGLPPGVFPLTLDVFNVLFNLRWFRRDQAHLTHSGEIGAVSYIQVNGPLVITIQND